MKKSLLFILAMLMCFNIEAKHFVTTWACSPQPFRKDDVPERIKLDEVTIKQTIHVSIGGTAVKLKLSNEYSDSTIEIRSVRLEDSSYLTFGGKRNVDIPKGEAVWSDVLKYNLRPLQRLNITIEYGRMPKNPTVHSGSRTTSVITKDTEQEGVLHWYTIAALDVKTGKSECIPAIGNSITDGRGTTNDMQNRWTDIASETLGAKSKCGVINLGIGGNAVCEGGIGPTALQRFDADVLSQHGVKRIIIFEGVNDIGCSNDLDKTCQNLIAGYKTMIRKAHERGLVVYGATITPFGKSFYYTDERERCRNEVNEWIRASDAFDAVIDFDQVLADPSAPSQLREEWQSDWLHPNAEGYKVMGEYAGKILKKKILKAKHIYEKNIYLGVAAGVSF
ncbi:MAG: SGNH/GDSL hydrolase family protein [Prevotellaceae bacterium]|nr:SGNH/GDSL hydrolase family protein [Prevotellaceae bacterium]